MEDIFIVSLRQQITQRFMNEIAFSGFLSGFATAYFALHAYQLFRRKNSSRLQMVVAVIFVQWALFNLKDFILTMQDYNDKTTQDFITLIDGTSLIGYTCLIYELIRPCWATWRKVFMILLAYVPFFILYFLWPDSLIIRCYMMCLFIAGTVIFLQWFRQAKQYIKYIRDYYSNIDEIDISWLQVVAVFFIVCQLIWVIISIVRHPLTDCLYYASSIILWQITLEHILYQQPVVMETSHFTVATEKKDYAFAEKVPMIIEEQQLYLNPTLTIRELAKHVGTNRTYLSDYFVHHLHTTFYDYINSMRIEKISLPLMDKYPERTLERIATESGFQSISTFRRSFQKLKGITPSEYKKQMKKAI